MCRVSVVIPIFNARQTVIRAVESVLSQSASDIEVILVNDGSRDDSLALIKEFKAAHADENIVIIDQKNGGVSKARNAGMRVAKGEFVAFLDSDDAWLPDKLSKQLDILDEEPSLHLVGTTMNGEVFEKFFHKRFSRVTEITLKNLLFKNFFQPSTVIVRREVMSTVGFFDESQKYAEEGNYFMRIAFGHKCALLNESLLNFGDGKRGFGSSGLSANVKEMEKGELKNLRYAYRHLNIGPFLYGAAVAFSLLKYVRRVAIVGIKKS